MVGNEELAVLLKMYEDCQVMRRYYLDARMRLSALLVTLYTVIIGLADRAHVDIPVVGAVLMVLAAFGIVCSFAYTSTYNLYWRRSRKLRQYIDDKFASGNVSAAYDAAKCYEPEDPADTHRLHSTPRFLRHHILWIALHVLVLLFGLFLILAPGAIYMS
ncbi:MAG: hypothetical protein IJ721_08350 [Bacteroidales bacterium]|nr:hypothetical protein [Bacteroidales bacterium]